MQTSREAHTDDIDPNNGNTSLTFDNRFYNSFKGDFYLNINVVIS